MTNSIVGQSKDHKVTAENIQQTDVLIDTLQSLNKSIANHEERIVRVEDTMRVNGIQEQKLTESVNRVVVSVLGGKKSQAYADNSVRSKAYSEINKRIKRQFGVPRRGEVPAKNYQECMELIAGWKPEYDLQQIIKAANSQMELLEA